MTSLEEARELRAALSEALYELRHRTDRTHYKEGEVCFRFDTIESILIWMLADTIRLCRDWEGLG